MKKASTIVDIAKALKISISTVSKALNDHPAIGEFTKERVKAKAKELNYIPNQAAKSFQQKKSFQIGVILPSLRDQFYVEAVTGMEAFAMNKNYIVFLCQSHEDPEHEKTLVNTMLLKRVDALIITVTKFTRDLEHLHQLVNVGIPVMYFVRIPEKEAVLSMKNNVFEAAERATNFLIGKGHTRIAHFKGPDVLSTSRERLAGYKSALEAAGLTYSDELVVETDLSQSGNEKAMQQLAGIKNGPTAALAFKDHVALDAATWLRKSRKKHAPLEWVGFGNSSNLRYLENVISASVEEQPYQLGELAAEKVISYIEEDKSTEPETSPDHTVCNCKLVIFK